MSLARIANIITRIPANTELEQRLSSVICGNLAATNRRYSTQQQKGNGQMYRPITELNDSNTENAEYEPPDNKIYGKQQKEKFEDKIKVRPGKSKDFADENNARFISNESHREYTTPELKEKPSAAKYLEHLVDDF